jgi:hypothetical protein
MVGEVLEVTALLTSLEVEAVVEVVIMGELVLTFACQQCRRSFYLKTILRFVRSEINKDSREGPTEAYPISQRIVAASIQGGTIVQRSVRYP